MPNENNIDNSNQVIIEHLSLQSKMHDAGYKLTLLGQCYGTSYMGMKAFTADDQGENLARYFERLKLINLKTAYYFDDLKKVLLGANANAERIDILAFFDGVVSLQSPANYMEIFKGNETVQPNNFAAQYVLGNTTKEGQIAQPYFSIYFTNALSRQELQKYIELLADKLTVRTSVMLSCSNHAICLCYDPDPAKKNQPWHLIDANYLSDQTLSSIELAQILPISLLADEDDELIYFSSKFYCSDENHQQLQCDVISITADESYKKALQVTAEKAIKTSKNAVSWLYIAALYGDIEKVKELLACNAKIDSFCNGGLSPLLVAAQNSHQEIVVILLEHGAKIDPVNDEGATPLFMAAQFGHQEIVAILLEHSAKVDLPSNEGATPLIMAAQFGHQKIVEILIKSKAEVNKSVFNGQTALWQAACNGHQAIVKLLLENGAKVDQPSDEGPTPLIVAAQFGHQTTVEILIKSKAEVNKSLINGQTALWQAAYNGHQATVKLLLKNGAKVDQRSYEGATPLFITAQNNQKETVKILLKAGADVNLTKIDEVSPLWVACMQGHLEVVNILLAVKGIEVDHQSLDQRTPLLVAAENGHFEIIAKLIKKGADVSLTKDGSLTNLGSAYKYDSRVKAKADNKIQQFTEEHPYLSLALQHPKLLSAAIGLFFAAAVITAITTLGATAAIAGAIGLSTKAATSAIATSAALFAGGSTFFSVPSLAQHVIGFNYNL